LPTEFDQGLPSGGPFSLRTGPRRGILVPHPGNVSGVAMSATRNFQVRALGEIAIRCINQPAMVAFYRDVIGLEPLNDVEAEAIAFFRIAEGFGGHTSVLALFRHDLQAAGNTAGSVTPPNTGAASSLHHLALSLRWDEQDAVVAWYEHLGLDYTVQSFDWIGWRGVFTFDPDGNTVELVAKDPFWTVNKTGK